MYDGDGGGWRVHLKTNKPPPPLAFVPQGRYVFKREIVLLSVFTLKKPPIKE